MFYLSSLPPSFPPSLSPLAQGVHLPIAVGSVDGRDCGLLLGRTVDGGRVRDGWLMGKIPPLLGRGGGGGGQVEKRVKTEESGRYGKGRRKGERGEGERGEGERGGREGREREGEERMWR